MLRVALGLVFIVLPLLELALLIKTGQAIGFWPTLGLVVGAGLLGAVVLSRQSLSAMRQAMAALEQGRPPVAPALDGAFLLLAATLLITPGFLTDFLALLLLIPPVRRGIARALVGRLLRRSGIRADAFGAKIEGGPVQYRPTTASPSEGPIIEGEFERLGERTEEPRGAGDSKRR